MKKTLSVIIPVLNEEHNIIPLTNKIIQKLKKYKFEIIFVDDSSIDNSKKILNKLKLKYSFFKPILRSSERDLTKSCFDGIKKSKYENILIMDGDLQHDPIFIPKMFDKYIKNNLDLVVGARKLYKSNNPGLSETRRFASLMLIYFFSFLNIKTKDPMSGFFLFKKKIFTKNKNRYFGKGFKILADLIINSKPKLKTEDVYIDFKKRNQNKSKMNYKVLLIIINFYLISLCKKLFIN